MDCSTPGFPSFTISQSLLKLISIESVMSSNHLILCCTLLFLPSIFTSIRVFSNELALMCYGALYWQVAYEIRKITYLRYVIYMSLYCTPDLVLGSWRIYVNTGMMDVWVEAWRQMCVQRGDTYRYKYRVEDTHTVQIHGMLCGLIGAHVCKVLCTHMYYAWGYIASLM